MRYHFAAGAVVLDAVAVDVQEDLAQVQLAAKDIPIREAVLLLMTLHAHVCFGGEQLHDVIDFCLQTRQIDRLAHKGKLALTEFAGLERVVDKGKQVSGGRPHLVVALPQQCLVVTVAFAELQKPQDAVQGGPHVMAHSVEEVGLHLACVVRALESLLKGLLLARLVLDRVVDVHEHAHARARDPPLVAAELRGGADPHAPAVLAPYAIVNVVRTALRCGDAELAVDAGQVVGGYEPVHVLAVFREVVPAFETKDAATLV